VRKVVSSGAGAALLRDLPRIKAILTAMRKVTALPLTVKIRAGWTKSTICAEEVARIAEGEGVDAITVHPRTADQGYYGAADWQLIARVKAAVNIPVIGNGDIRTAQDAQRMRLQTTCDAVMLGRGVLGYPWLFREIAAQFSGWSPPSPPSWEERLRVIHHHLHSVVNRWGESVGVRIFRKHLLWYTRGVEGGPQLRQQLSRVSRIDEIAHLLAGHKATFTLNKNLTTFVPLN